MIYLGHNATTPISPEVLEAMTPYLTSEWGNPSSSYKFGSKLKSMIETAREQVADLIGAHPREVIFTSCATESNNAAIHAALRAHLGKRHIVTSSVERSSVMNYCVALEDDFLSSIADTQSNRHKLEHPVNTTNVTFRGIVGHRVKTKSIS